MKAPSVTSVRALAKRCVITAGLEACGLAVRSGAFRKAAGRGVVFTLHHVRPHDPRPFDPNAHLSITPAFLAAAIERLVGAGMVPAALEDVPQRLARDDGDRFFVFTLDDGYRDNADHALPVFERYGVPFTVFVAGGFVDRTHSIWWETAEALLRASDRFSFDYGAGVETLHTRTPKEKTAAYAGLHTALTGPDQDRAIAALDATARTAGIDPLAVTASLTMDAAELANLAAHPLASLGAHTIGHPALAAVDSARLTTEMTASADRLAAITGTRPATFAYPYGDPRTVSPREHRAAADCGFSLAVTTSAGVIGANAMDAPTRLNRISLNGRYQKARYAEALASGLPFKLSRPGSPGKTA